MSVSFVFAKLDITCSDLVLIVLHAVAHSLKRIVKHSLKISKNARNIKKSP